MQSTGGVSVAGTGAKSLLNVGKWDVHGSWNWALNLGSTTDDVRQYVPRIKMIEYNLTSSSQLNAFKLFLSQTQSQLDLAGVDQNIESNIATLFANSAINNLNQYVGENNGTAQPGGFSETDPYYGLYQGKVTGNEYVLPYLSSQNMTSVLGSWAKVDDKNLVTALAKAAIFKSGGFTGKIATDILGQIQSAGLTYEQFAAPAETLASLNAPGISKETIKMFTPNENGDTITTTFYLFNTEKVSDILDNWNFLFALTYQNLPNRKSLSRMDPPCIYDVTVPGFKRFPVAVVSGLKVDNLGTTRLVDITTGEMMSVNKAESSKNVKIIPEAYKVTITIQSLLINSRNLFYYNYDQTDSGAKINVITSPDQNNQSKQALTKNLEDATNAAAAAAKAAEETQSNYNNTVINGTAGEATAANNANVAAQNAAAAAVANLRSALKSSGLGP